MVTMYNTQKVAIMGCFIHHCFSKVKVIKLWTHPGLSAVLKLPLVSDTQYQKPQIN